MSLTNCFVSMLFPWYWSWGEVLVSGGAVVVPPQRLLDVVSPVDSDISKRRCDQLLLAGAVSPNVSENSIGLNSPCLDAIEELVVLDLLCLADLGR